MQKYVEGKLSAAQKYSWYFTTLGLVQKAIWNGDRQYHSQEILCTISDCMVLV